MLKSADLYSGIYPGMPIVIRVSGQRDPSDVMRLNGSARSLDYYAPSADAQVDLSIQIAESAGALAGSAHYILNGSSIASARDDQILFAREITASPISQMSGAWSGFMTLETCSGTCLGDRRYESQLLLAQTGAQVNGSDGPATVSGTFVANALTLDGAKTPEPSCRPISYNDVYCSLEVRYSARMDEFERLSGTYYEKISYYPESSGLVEHEATYRFTDLVRWP